MTALFIVTTVVFIVISGLLFKKVRQKDMQYLDSDADNSKHSSATCCGSHDPQHVERISELDFKINMVVEAGKIGIWDFDFQNDRFSYTDKNCSFLQDITWDEFVEMIYPDDRHIAIKNMQDLTTTGITNLQSAYRIRIPTYDEPQWFDTVVFKNKYAPDGKVTVFSGILWNVTDKIGEQQKLANSKAILDLTLIAGGIIPWEFDLVTDLIASENEYSILYNKPQNIQKYIKEFIHPDHRVMFMQQIQQIKKKETGSMNCNLLTLRNDKYEWTHFAGKVIEDPQTKHLKVVGTIRFTTSEVEKQEQLIALKKEADEANRMKSAFLANMSHEIRTPLSAIVGFSRLVAETASGNEDTREYVNVIETNTEMLMRLINDILDLSKIEAGILEFEFDQVDICEVFSYLKQLYELKMPAEVELICDIPQQPVMINVDKNRFIQVLSNFLNNAVKYTSQGSISLGYSTAGNSYRFYVRDTGKGISKENCAKVFDRFAKFDPSVAGTGLGMSISQNIIHKFNGQIGVDSEEGKGSEFWFTIPA